MTDDELLTRIDFLRDTLISVSTGGARIQEVEDRYKVAYNEVAQELRVRNIINPIRFRSLWEWHGRWGKGDLPSWASRRLFIGELFNPLEDEIKVGQSELPELTGWPKVDRTIPLIQSELRVAKKEEQFQAIGLLCRETLISLAQMVFDPKKQLTVDMVIPSNTDAKRMLEAYILFKLPGKSNEEVRKFARSALDMANYLQHHRTATFPDAALCFEATKTVINIVAILEGRRG